MGTLQYRGKAIGGSSDVAYLDYLALVKNADLTVAEIDNVINTGLAGYATVGYVDSRDALNATKAYVDAGDAARLKLSQKNVSNGVCPLDPTGRVSPQRINAPLTQKWVRGPWTPPAYNAAAVNVTTETTLYTCPVTDPGYPYKLVVFGQIDARPDRETEYPIINVRVGAANGEIVAQGAGQLDVPDASIPANGEKFDVPNTDGLEDATWNQTVLAGTAGHYQVINNQAQWVQSGNNDRIWRFRRLGTDAVTLTDYQRLRMTIGTAAGEGASLGENVHQIIGCTRMNTAETEWVGFILDNNTFGMAYCLGGTISLMSGAGWTVTPSTTFSTSPGPGVSYDVLSGTVNNVRQYIYFRNNVLIGGAVDVNNITKVGPTYRGWGWIASAGHRTFDQSDPPDVTELLITDAPPSFGSVSVVPFNSHSHITRTGSTTLYITGARSGAASTCVVSPYKPRLNVFAVPA